MTRALIVALLATLGTIDTGPAPHVPTIDDLLNLQTVAGARISPDGKWVAYGVVSTDFDQDAFVTQIWVAPTEGGGPPYQLTRGAKSSTGVRWSPDSRWIGFVSSRVGDKAQVFAIRPDGGEAVQLTKSESGVEAFEWSPDGAEIAFSQPLPKTAIRKRGRNSSETTPTVHRDYGFVQLWTVTVAEAMRSPSAGVMRTHGSDRSVDEFAWSPDHTRLAFSATRTPDLIDGGTSDIYVLTLQDDTVRAIVSQPGPDGVAILVTGWHAHRVSIGHGPGRLLPCRRQDCRRKRGGRRRAVADRQLRRRPVADCLGRGRHLLLFAAENRRVTSSRSTPPQERSGGSASRTA